MLACLRPLCAGERLVDHIAAWSDRTGLALIVDADVDLESPVVTGPGGGSDVRALQLFLARQGLYAQALEPGVYRIRRDGSGLTLSIIGRDPPESARGAHRPHPTDQPSRVFRPRLLPGMALEQIAQVNVNQRLRTLPNLYTIGELVSLRGISRGEDEAQFSLVENGLPVTPDRLSAPLQLSSQSSWLSAVSGPDSAVRGPNALGGWIELGRDSPGQGGAIELRAGNDDRGSLRAQWVPWESPRGAVSVAGYGATQSSTVVEVAGARLPRPADAGIEAQWDWQTADESWHARTYVLGHRRALGYPWLHLAPTQPDQPDADSSALSYDGEIQSETYGVSQRFDLNHGARTTRLELGWLRSSRDEESSLSVLDSSDFIARRFEWSRVALSSEIGRDDERLATISLQYLPRRVQRSEITALVPGGELFRLRDGLVNAGEGNIVHASEQVERLDSWLLSWDDEWALGADWRLGLRLGWALEQIDSALVNRATSSSDCLLSQAGAAAVACSQFYPDARIAQRDTRSEQIPLPAVGLQYTGARSEQLLGWRRGYGRSRAAVDLIGGGYHVFAPERIEAIEYSLVDIDPARRWRADVFAYHWRNRRSFRRQPGEIGAVLLDTGDGGRALATGLELTGRWGDRQWSLSAAAGLLHARYVSGSFAGAPLDGKRLEDAPRYTASIATAWRGERGWFADVSLQLAGATYLDASNQPDARRPALRTLDLSFGRRVGPWDVFLFASHLSDQSTFQSVIPRSGLGLQGSSYLIVDGPSVGLGLRWRTTAD